MTNSQPDGPRPAFGDPLDRIEALVESNARSIQALGIALLEITHVQAEATEERQELRQEML